MKNKLAIVIPAYKADYFELALESISKQTCKNFILYIGDDASPYDLNLIVDKFKSELDIHYFRFSENIGGTDLVKQWERCIDLTEDEEWIWLFSDDDILDSKCVELFFEYIKYNDHADLLHFNVKVIDHLGIEKFVNLFPKFPKLLSGIQFFEKKINWEIQSFVVEYIFKRSLYENEGGFVNFDLAWCSDDATWIKFANKSGIHTIDGCFVFFRFSGINISSYTNNIPILRRKLNAKLNYLLWSKFFFGGKRIKVTISQYNIMKWFLKEITESKILSIKSKAVFAFKYSCKLSGFCWGLVSFFYLIGYEFKKSTQSWHNIFFVIKNKK